MLYPHPRLSGCSALKALSLESVSRIGPYAFEDCSSLGRLSIPSRLLDLSASAFHSCSALKELLLGSEIEDLDLLGLPTGCRVSFRHRLKRRERPLGIFRWLKTSSARSAWPPGAQKAAQRGSAVAETLV